jgi:hypothetical protein
MIFKTLSNMRLKTMTRLALPTNVRKISYSTGVALALPVVFHPTTDKSTGKACGTHDERLCHEADCGTDRTENRTADGPLGYLIIEFRRGTSADCVRSFHELRALPESWSGNAPIAGISLIWLRIRVPHFRASPERAKWTTTAV